MDNQQQQAEQDDNCSIAASDFIQLEQPTADGSLQEEQQEHGNGSLFNPNVIDWSNMDARSTIGDEFNELKLKMATLEVFSDAIMNIPIKYLHHLIRQKIKCSKASWRIRN
jgi:hypothetical protein